MDTSMTDEEGLNLPDYINQFVGHQRFTRLLSIIDNAAKANLSEGAVKEAILLGYQLAQ